MPERRQGAAPDWSRSSVFTSVVDLFGDNLADPWSCLLCEPSRQQEQSPRLTTMPKSLPIEGWPRTRILCCLEAAIVETRPPTRTLHHGMTFKEMSRIILQRMPDLDEAEVETLFDGCDTDQVDIRGRGRICSACHRSQ